MAVLIGVRWGVAGVALVPIASQSHQIFMAVLISGVSAGAVVAFCPCPGAMFQRPLLFRSRPLCITCWAKDHMARGDFGVIMLIFGVSDDPCRAAFAQPFQHPVLDARVRRKASLVEALSEQNEGLKEMNAALQKEAEERTALKDWCWKRQKNYDPLCLLFSTDSSMAWRSWTWQGI